MKKTMSETQLAQKAGPIIRAIDDRINQYEVSHLYIGTEGDDEDFKDRYEDHTNGDGYTFMWKLAIGTYEQIAQMEDYLIKHYKKHNERIIDNENVGSGGKNGGILYVCMLAERDLIIEELHDDTSEIAPNFPLDLTK